MEKNGLGWTYLFGSYIINKSLFWQQTNFGQERSRMNLITKFLFPGEHPEGWLWRSDTVRKSKATTSATHDRGTVERVGGLWRLPSHRQICSECRSGGRNVERHGWWHGLYFLRWLSCVWPDVTARHRPRRYRASMRTDPTVSNSTHQSSFHTFGEWNGIRSKKR
jgi:hypothetical protein